MTEACYMEQPGNRQRRARTDSPESTYFNRPVKLAWVTKDTNQITDKPVADLRRVLDDASAHINNHIMQEGDPTGELALAIDLLDHHVGLPCEVCS
jgi:hypothetical protein